MHQLKLSLIHEKNKSIIALKQKQAQELAQQYEALQQQAPELYQNYLRAMFNEWNNINPLLKTQHEEFYKRLLDEYSQKNKQHTNLKQL